MEEHPADLLQQARCLIERALGLGLPEEVAPAIYAAHGSVSYALIVLARQRRPEQSGEGQDQ